jgi:hypothetical protein
MRTSQEVIHFGERQQGRITVRKRQRLRDECISLINGSAIGRAITMPHVDRPREDQYHRMRLVEWMCLTTASALGLQGVAVLGMAGRVTLPRLPDLGLHAQLVRGPLVAEALDRLKRKERASYCERKCLSWVRR